MSDQESFDEFVAWTIVVAAGSGSRFGAVKQYERLDGRRVIDYACDTARRASHGIVVVLPSDEAVSAWTSTGTQPERAVAGGSTRSESVRAGLAAVPAPVDIICVHDAARPLATDELFARVITAVHDGAAGAVPALAVTDTIKVVDSSGTVTATPERSTLVSVQTPQAFAAPALRRAHAAGADSTDDAALVELAGGRVVVVPGEVWNRKITEPDDLEWARSWLQRGVDGDHELAQERGAS